MSEYELVGRTTGAKRWGFIRAATATNQSTGGGGAHPNVQPYVVVFMWKRTA